MSTIDVLLCDALARRGAQGDTCASTELFAQLKDHIAHEIDSSWREMQSSRPTEFVSKLVAHMERAVVRPETLRQYTSWCGCGGAGRGRGNGRTFADWLQGVLDDAIGDDLARRGAAGDRSAVKNLLARLHGSWVVSIKSSWRLRSVADSEEVARDIALNLVRRIDRADALRSYVAWRERNPAKAFTDWMRIVVVNAIRSHLKPSRNSMRNLIQMHVPFEGASVRPSYTDGYCIWQLRSVAGEILSGVQLTTLNSWLEGASFDEISLIAECTSAEAQKHLRAAIAKLRRKFPKEEAI